MQATIGSHDPTREPGPVKSALCWSHARRKFFELADIEGNIRKGKPAKETSPIAFEAVKRIDTVFAIEREINGHDPVVPQAWLADVITRISGLPVSKLPELLPWNWQQLAA